MKSTVTGCNKMPAWVGPAWMLPVVTLTIMTICCSMTLLLFLCFLPHHLNQTTPQGSPECTSLPSFDLLSVQHDVPLPHNSYAALQAYLTTLRPTNPRNTPQHIIPQDTPTQQTPPTASLQHQVLFTNHLYQQHCHHFITNQQSTNHTAVAMVALTAIDQHTLSTHLLPWLQYHITTIGICGKIYLLYDGTDVKTFSLLQQLSPLVYTQALQRPLASQTLFDHYQGYVETIQQHLPRPLRGNTLLMVKQQYAMACGLTWAANDKQQWLVHLDPDELLSLEGPQGAVGIVKVLEGVPPHVPSVRFLNAEAQAEEGVVPPFAEEGLDGIGGGSWGDAFRKVTLFRAHRAWTCPKAESLRIAFAIGGQHAFTRLYVNGKSAVRVDADAWPEGPHYFAGPANPRWASADNVHGVWQAPVHPHVLVLHYAYSSPADVLSRANAMHRQCGSLLLQSVVDGAWSTALQECVLLDFDRHVLTAVPPGNATAAAAFFQQHLLLTEGAPVRCPPAVLSQNSNTQPAQDMLHDSTTPRDGLTHTHALQCSLHHVEWVKEQLLRLGILLRRNGPQQVLQQLAYRYQLWLVLNNKG